ncbi:MAG: sigma-70 family RNA polymerase sigma factor [Candidatus Sericytochromatia bacterium]|nr:sigma-70 family RNA polymerase sigma factor [Candidatus Sericytochromatia bacterium]
MTTKKPTDVQAKPRGQAGFDDEQLKKYLPMVRSIARRISTKLPRHYEVEDLVSDGVMGLMAAAERFDPERGVKFETFATYYIKGAILDNLPKLPTIQNKQPKPAEVEPGTNEDEEVQSDAVALTSKVTQITYSYILSLDAPQGSGEDGEDFNLLKQLGKSDTVQHEMELEELQQILRLAIEQLPIQERTTLRYYYFHHMSFSEIGQKLGLSESWVSRIHRRALEQLRHKLGKKKSIDDFISW